MHSCEHNSRNNANIRLSDIRQHWEYLEVEYNYLDSNFELDYNVSLFLDEISPNLKKFRCDWICLTLISSTLQWEDIPEEMLTIHCTNFTAESIMQLFPFFTTPISESDYKKVEFHFDNGIQCRILTWTLTLVSFFFFFFFVLFLLLSIRTRSQEPIAF